MKRLGKWSLYGLAVIIALMVIFVLLQAVGIMPSNEEFDMTSTAESETEVAQALAITNDTATAAASITPTLTPAPTNTLPPTATFTPTNTLPPTGTPTPSPTPAPEDHLRELVDSVVIGNIIGSDIDESENVVSAVWRLSENLLGSDSGFAGDEMLKVACKIKEDETFAGHTLVMSAWVDVIDSFGNEDTIIGVYSVIEWDTIERINCDNVDSIDIANIAEQFIVHPVLD